MTEHQINCKIMEWLDYKFVPEHDSHVGVIPECWIDEHGQELPEAHNFCKDHDLMYWAEEVLRLEHSRAMMECYLDSLLCEVCDDPDAPSDDIDYEHQWRMVHAQPVAKARALVKSIGGWKYTGVI